MRTAILTLSLLFSGFLTIAQDYHHWSEHFGTRATLLGGAATSGLGDNATVYYNPAAMAFVEDPSISISVNAYRLRFLNLKNALGEGLDLKSTQFSTFPNLIAGITTFKKAPAIRLGYSVLTRRFYANKFDFLHQANYDILSGTAGQEIFVGSYNLNHRMNEYWAGFGVSWRPTKSFSMGFSHFGIYRDVKYSNSHATYVMPEDGTFGDVPNVSTNVTFNYWNVKGIFKPSIALSLDNFKFGMSVTTPSFNIMGRASVYRDYSILNFDELLGFDVSIIDRADKVKAIHKEEGSIAFGVSWKLGRRSWLHWTNETYFGGQFYHIFNPEQRPSTFPTTFSDSTLSTFFGGENFLSYGEETVPITNIGIGFESRFNDRWEMYLGMRTDFLYNERPYYTYSTIGVESSKWHILHLSYGMVHTTKKGKRYTAGIEYGVAPKRPYYHILDYTTPSVNNGLIGNGSANGIASQHSFKIVFGVVLMNKDKT